MASKRFHVGGAVPTDGFIYVRRPEEDRFLECLDEGRWITVTGCRTMGKSSLIVHCKDGIERDGKASVKYVDIAGQIERGVPTFAEWLQLLAWACGIHVDNSIATLASRSPLELLLDLLIEPALETLEPDERLLLVLDEIDVIASLPFRVDLLRTLRAFQAQQAQEASLRRISFCLVGLRPFYELAAPEDGAASPLGESIRMRDFQADTQTVAEIAEGFSSSSREIKAVVERILYHTGGQPYLTIHLADLAARERATSIDAVNRIVESFLARQRRRPMELMRLIQDIIVSDEVNAISALSTYSGLLEGREEARTLQAPGAKLLLLSGLVRTGDRGLEIKGPIFKRHFSRAWAEHAQAEVSVRQTTTRQSYATRRARRRAAKPPRICVMNTGGTIGMFEQPDGTVRPPQNSREFLSRYHQIQDLADVTFVPLFNLDSVNVYPPQWATIAQAICDRRQEGFDGFVIAHGTDTMAFTSSAVAFALGKEWGIPVVFTGSQTTIDVPHGDALSNLYRACMVALEPIPEVVICFGEYVFRAVRAQKKAEERFDAFESPNYPALAYVGESVELRSEFVRRPPAAQDNAAPRIRFQEEGILLLYQYPGSDPRFFLRSLAERDKSGDSLCKGIVIQTSGAGNVSSRLPFSYVSFLEKAQQLGIPVIITSQYPGRRSVDPRFLTASWPLQYGAIPVGNITAAAAVTKFHWVLGQIDDAIKSSSADRFVDIVRSMMQTDYVGEIDTGTGRERSEHDIK